MIGTSSARAIMLASAKLPENTRTAIGPAIVLTGWFEGCFNSPTTPSPV